MGSNQRYERSCDCSKRLFNVLLSKKNASEVNWEKTPLRLDKFESSFETEIFKFSEVLDL